MTTALGAADTITITFTSAASTFRSYEVCELSGVTAKDASATEADGFRTNIALPLTTVAASTAIVAIIAQQHAQTYTVGGGFTLISTQTNGRPARSDYVYRVVSSAASYDPAGNMGSADNNIGAICSYKP